MGYRKKGFFSNSTCIFCFDFLFFSSPCSFCPPCLFVFCCCVWRSIFPPCRLFLLTCLLPSPILYSVFPQSFWESSLGSSEPLKSRYIVCFYRVNKFTTFVFCYFFTLYLMGLSFFSLVRNSALFSDVFLGVSKENLKEGFVLLHCYVMVWYADCGGKRCD